MTLLSMCQQVASEVGIPQLTSIIGNSSDAARGLLAAAQTEGRILAKGSRPDGKGTHNWAVLRKEQTFSTVSSQEDYALTSSGIITDGDFERFVPDTWWDRTNNRPLTLVNVAEWQVLKSSLAASAGIDKYIIQRGSSILIDPTPDAVETYVFEYTSNKWCQSSGGTEQSSWAADSDVGITSEHLMALGIKWRYLRRNGEPYADEREEYNNEVLIAMGEEGGRATIGRSMKIDVLNYNLPDTGYG